MSLLKQLSDKLDDILKEETAEDGTSYGNSKPKINSNKRNCKKLSKKIKEENEWEDLLEEDEVPLLNVDKNSTIHQSVVPLFPSDVASVQENSTKREQPKSRHLKSKFKDESNKELIDLFNPKSYKTPPLFKGLQNSEGFVEAKMVELSKKIRELNAQLISTQNKLKIAETHIASQDILFFLQNQYKRKL